MRALLLQVAAALAPSHHVLITTDGLGALAAQRFGVQAEVLVAAHHSIAAYPWLLSTETQGPSEMPPLLAYPEDHVSTAPQYDTRTEAGGVDFQWRYYGGSAAPRGLFAAAGFVVQGYK
jgi:hypothetical protein